VHCNWVEAICEEFYLQGDREAAMGMMVRRFTFLTS
jgi:hypothetical protein